LKDGKLGDWQQQRGPVILNEPCLKRNEKSMVRMKKFTKEGTKTRTEKKRGGGLVENKRQSFAGVPIPRSPIWCVSA